jgi:hypothetical protein
VSNPLFNVVVTGRVKRVSGVSHEGNKNLHAFATWSLAIIVTPRALGRLRSSILPSAQSAADLHGSATINGHQA